MAGCNKHPGGRDRKCFACANMTQVTVVVDGNKFTHIGANQDLIKLNMPQACLLLHKLHVALTELGTYPCLVCGKQMDYPSYLKDPHCSEACCGCGG